MAWQRSAGSASTAELLLTDWLRIRLGSASVWSVGRLFNLSAYKTVAHAVGKCEMWASSCSQGGAASIWGARTLHGQLWLCPRFNALMLPEFYGQSRAEQGKRNAVSVSWPFLAKKLLTIKIKKFSIYAACWNKSNNNYNYNCMKCQASHNQILCVSECVCVGVHKSCTAHKSERATEQTGQTVESLVCLSICPTLALCALICGHKA